MSPGCTVKPELSEAAQLTASGDDRGGPPSIGALAAEIVRGDVSGSTNTSHTIVVGALASLLDAVPADAPQDAYEAAALGVNVLGKDTDGARKRTYRHLRELYLLRPDSLLFRALRDLWPVDPQARPLLAGLCALARDSVFRASSTAITRSSMGDTVTARGTGGGRRRAFPRQLWRGNPGQDRPQHPFLMGADRPSSRRGAGHEGPHPGIVPAGRCCLCAAARPRRRQAQPSAVRDRVGAGPRPADLPPPRPRSHGVAARDARASPRRRCHRGGLPGAAPPVRPHRSKTAVVSYVDELLAAYRKFVALPWQQNLAPPQRVSERRGRAHERPWVRGDDAPGRSGAAYSWRTPKLVFVNSMSDLFHAKVPVTFMQQVLAVMADTPQHTYQVLSTAAPATHHRARQPGREVRPASRSVHLLRVSPLGKDRPVDWLPEPDDPAGGVHDESVEPAPDDDIGAVDCGGDSHQVAGSHPLGAGSGKR